MASGTTIDDLPNVILSNIFSLVTDTRSRNSLSLVCRRFLGLERETRVTLTLRGNARDLFHVPGCFGYASHLDLSLLSPWGHSLLSSPSSDHLRLLAHRFRLVFSSVDSLTVYSRSPITLAYLLPQWPRLRRLKLVRWHQRPQISIGDDFIPVFEHCSSLESLDLSAFYHWTEDLAPVLTEYHSVSVNLTSLNLLTPSLPEGFKSNEIIDITKACPNLTSFCVACSFNPWYIGFVGDETLLAVAANCPKLSILHMSDTKSLSSQRANQDADLDQESADARITTASLVELFSALPLLGELVLDVGKTVRHSGVAFETLNSRCKNLKVLKLGNFHEVCTAEDWRRLDGVALCGGLESLTIKNSADLTNMGLIAIGKGCRKLAKFEIQGCEMVTVDGLRTMTDLLRNTLIDVKISCCKNLDANASIRALEPIQARIQRLHIDCVWGRSEEDAVIRWLDLNKESELTYENADELLFKKTKRLKYSCDEDCSHTLSYGNSGDCSNLQSNRNEFRNEEWGNLQYLSLWFSVGELLTPLTLLGLDDCPNLEEIQIKIEGDCRGREKVQGEFGLSCLMPYTKLTKMRLDCGDTIGYSLTAPSGQMDLNIWERFFLSGIGCLNLTELDYWPPQDRDVNQRSLSLPATALLAQCPTLRKLFIHGTAYEHFMMMLLEKIPNLRDVQLRADYYPAPDSDTTEMRDGSCTRFENALNARPIID